jgi:hypothetical protein
MSPSGKRNFLGGRRTALAAFLAASAALVALSLLCSRAPGEVVQKRGVRVSVIGSLVPSRLPRRGTAPVAVTIGGNIASLSAGMPPQLQKLTVQINRHGHLDRRGLPNCRIGDIDPSSTAGALLACRPSLIGVGHFSANVKIPEQSPFPSEGKVLAFNGRFRGQPAILAHVYGTEPVPTSYVLPFLIHGAKGQYGTSLEASLPLVTGDWGYITGLRLKLSRRFSTGGRSHSFVAAGCPAPSGFRRVVFPLTRTIFSFAGGLSLTSTLTKNCQVRN